MKIIRDEEHAKIIVNKSPEVLIQYFNDIPRGEHSNEYWLLLFSEVKGETEGYVFPMNETMNSRQVFGIAQLENAESIIIVGYHERALEPDAKEVVAIQALLAVGEFLGIPIQDFLIIGKTDTDAYYSFKERQLINN